MANETKIEWADSTMNPWIGCTKVSPACDHCYAAVSTPARTLGIEWGAGRPRRRTSASTWAQPVLWNKRPFASCNRCGWRGEERELFAGAAKGSNGICPACSALEEWKPARRRVFCASLADVFDNEVDPQWRADLFALIEATPNLDWLLLTKRIGNVAKMAPLSWMGGPIQHGPDPANIHGGWPPNLWLGATVCNQAEADRDIPKLVNIRARIRFLSMEPLLGPVNFQQAHIAPYLFARVDWVITGGESGHAARPMHPDWIRSLRDQCAKAGIPFLLKQWGEWEIASLENGHVDCRMPETGETKTWVDLNGLQQACTSNGLVDPYAMARVGKKKAGRTLDGRTHTEFPGGAQ